MAVVNTVQQTEANVYQISVTLTSANPIADPIAYVAQPDILNEILAKAGLPDDLVYVAAAVTRTSVIASIYEYDLLVTFDNTEVTATGHSHDHDTLFFPLDEAYKNGPTIDIDSDYGPVIFSAPDGTSDFFRILKDGNDLFYVKGDGELRMGGDVRFYPDNTYDIGYWDGGILYRRPKDLRLGGDMYGDGDLTIGGFGSFGSQVEGTPNPDNTPTSRHIYWNSVDNQLHKWDGTWDTVIGTGGNTIDATFTSTTAVNVLDAVRLISSNTVDQAVASTSDRVVGFCVSKPNATTAVVRLIGEVSGFGGLLIPNRTYYLSLVVGTITDNPGTLTPGSWSQVVGVSRNNSTLIIRLEKPVQI
jgi:hypothetical protein